MTSIKPDRVWVKPPMAIKAHYFVNGRTLCGGIFFFSYSGEKLKENIDKCPICLRKMRTRQGKHIGH